MAIITIKRILSCFKMSLLLGALMCISGCGKPEPSDALKKLFGQYVGIAHVETPKDVKETRDLDVVVKPFQNSGFSIEWTTVSYEISRLDEKVTRKNYRINFIRIDPERTLYKVELANNPFKEKQDSPQLGSPLVWAKLSDDDHAELKLYSLYPLPNGGYHLQSYIREFTNGQESAVSLLFQVLENGETKRLVRGSLRKILDDNGNELE